MVLISPWLFVFALFWAWPVADSFIMSFKNEGLLRYGQGKFVGLDNYTKLFSDEKFTVSFKNTLIFVAGTIPFTTALALGLALLIKYSGKFREILRPSVFIPSLVSLVVVAVIFKSLYANPSGPINKMLRLFGFEPIGFLTQPNTALLSIMLMNIWAATGYYSLLYLSALLSIPPELYEAASVDGAGSLACFFRITLPQLKPMTAFIIVINTIRSFQVFPEVFTLTQGGPINSTSTVVFNLYEEAFARFNVGYASAQAYVLVAITIIISLFQMKILNSQKDIS